jgi:uncharacterized membrane protein (UPF0127 family)
MVLVNSTKKTAVCDRCHFADSVLKRMVGLLNRKTLLPGDGLLLDRCYGIHTIGMRFPIDVLFLDKELRVMRAVQALPPYRTCVVRQAVYVLELPVGAIQASRTEAGDQIQMRTTATETTTSLKAPASEKVQAASR